jgi:CHASE2 domain-containing sensor protein
LGHYRRTAEKLKESFKLFTAKKAFSKNAENFKLQISVTAQTVNKNTTTRRQIILLAGGALLVSLCGLVLGESFLGQSWANASYDYLFRFGTHPVTNNVVLILMDNASFDQFHQTRGQPWDRGLHAQLLNKLADDQCRMVVMDSIFKRPLDPDKDAALTASMRRLNIVLMAEQAQVENADFSEARPILPCQPFLAAAKSNWGVAWLDPDIDMIVRRHWPFPSPGPYPSMPETAVKSIDAALDLHPRERWLRYYGENGAWKTLSYGSALTQPKDYFRNKIIFVGTQPKTVLPGHEDDQFSTPFTRWTGDATGGVEVVVTAFLNLMNHDWLYRPAPWMESIIFVAAGIFFGAGLCWMRTSMACICGIAGGLILTLAAISFSYTKNIWFPWLAMVGGQMPCAVAWTVIANRMRRSDAATAIGKKALKRPKIPGFKLFHPPFGQGTFGSVWLARKPNGDWCALKVIYRSNFDADSTAYEREFDGINTYKALSGEHPGLLRVDLVSEKTDGFFYYAMELGDSLEADWQRKPAAYKPRDLAGERARSIERRISVRKSVDIGLVLTEALSFLHARGLAHRDIKPQNIIMVNGLPKLADLGLVRQLRPPEEIKTIIGTPGYMPPPPEPPGTLQADIFALGMVLYVISTGREAALFPEISTNLMNGSAPADFLGLNAIILKACDVRLDFRYASALEMHQDLRKLSTKMQTHEKVDPATT